MKRIILLVIFVQAAIMGMAQNRADLSIVITGLKNTDGQVLIALFDGPESFPETASSAMSSQKLSISGDTVRASFMGLPTGVYAVSFVHDENRNDIMDKRMGIPREKYGVSNNIRMGFGPPSFNEAKFYIKGDTTIYIKPSN